MIHTHFYDQLLGQIEVGNARDGIIHLVGMLDAAGLDEAQFTQICAELRNHRLFQLLQEDPLHACVSNNSDRLETLLCGSAPEGTSATGRMLFDITRELTLCRAMRERRVHAHRELLRAWEDGETICVVDGSLLAGLAGRDLSNIVAAVDGPACAANLRLHFGNSLTVIEAEAVGYFADFSTQSRCFDLVCAPGLADRHDAISLAAMLVNLRKCLSPSGRILLSSLAPQHLGTGWRVACLGWTVNCHEESDLWRAAQCAGLEGRVYRDATNSIVWGELTQSASSGAQVGGAGHEQ